MGRFLCLVCCNGPKRSMLWFAASCSGLKRNFGAEMPERVGNALPPHGYRLQVLPWCSWDFWYPGARWEHWVNTGKNRGIAQMVEGVVWTDLGIRMTFLKCCLGVTCVGRWTKGTTELVQVDSLRRGVCCTTSLLQHGPVHFTCAGLSAKADSCLLWCCIHWSCLEIRL